MHDAGPGIDAVLLVDEVAGVIPAADLVGRREALGVRPWLALYCASPIQNAPPSSAEGGAVLVAELGDARAGRVAILAGRIAGEHRAEQRQVFGRVDLQPNAGRRQRIGRAAARQIGRHDAGPAEGAVDQTTRGGAGQKFVVRRELTDPDRGELAEFLLEPGGEQPGGGDRVDVARIGDRAGIGGGVLAVGIVDLERADMSLAAGPADQLFQVGVDDHVEAAFERRVRTAGDRAAGDAEGLADILQNDLDALVFQRGAGAAPVAGQAGAFLESFLGDRGGAGGPDGGEARPWRKASSGDLWLNVSHVVPMKLLIGTNADFERQT